MFRPLSKILLFCLLTTVAVQWRTGGFSPEHIKVPLVESADPVQEPFHDDWPRHFTYLGRGHQAFAFESDRYVIKFFDRAKMELPWYQLLASKKWVARRHGRSFVYPNSYRLAYQYMRNETALLHVHLAKNEMHYPTITVTDRGSRQFTIDLNEVPFILQEKAESSFLETLENSADVRPLLEQYMAMQQKRIALGIANHDRHIKDNYRCQGNRLIYIDPGRYFLDEKLSVEAEWDKATYELKRWVSEKMPTFLEVVTYPFPQEPI